MIKNKRIMAFLLAISIFILMSPANVFAEEEIKIEWCAGWDSENNPDSIYYTVNGIDGMLNVGYGKDWGSRLDFVETRFPVDYNIPVEKTGYYELVMELRGDVDFDILIDDVKQLEYSIRNKPDSNLRNFTLGNVYLEEGTRKFSIKQTLRISSDNIRAQNISLAYIGDTAVTSVSVEDGETVPRATDIISIELANKINEEFLDEAEASLIAQNSGKTIPLLMCVDNGNDKKVIFAFCESLDYNETYSLSYTDIPHGFSFKENGEICFATYEDAQTDTSESNASVEIDSIEFADNIFTLKGTVKGSIGQSISGRKVTVTVTHPNNGGIGLTPVITDENGIYTAQYQIEGTDNDNGVYRFDISAEYCSEGATEHGRYISEGEKNRILKNLEELTQGDEISHLLTNNDNEIAKILGADLESLAAISGTKSDFYTRLASASFKNSDNEYDVDMFAKVWNASLAMEIIEKTSDKFVTESVLGNENYTSALGLDLGRFELLNNEKDNFLNAVTDMPRQESAADFAKEFDRLANISLVAENGLSQIELNVDNYEIYDGQTADIELTLVNAVSKVAKYTLSVKCSNANDTQKLKLVLATGSISAKEIDADTVIFSAENLPNDIKSLGTISFDSNGTGVSSFDISGTAEYVLENISYPIFVDVVNSTSNIVIKKKAEYSGDSGKTLYKGGGSIGGGVSISSKPAVNPSVSPDSGDNVSKYEFIDIADVEWAEKSINDLYTRGIISKAEDRKFRPNDNITRAEFIKMLVETLGIGDKTSKVTFSDVTNDAWYSGYVSSAVYYGLVNGDENNHFNPDKNITRQDICVLLSRAMDKLGYTYDSVTEQLFSDDTSISDYARDAVYRMKSREIINGMGNDMFSPMDNATRAMTAKMICNFIEEAGL